jgi:hypothetical protein
VFTNKIKKGDYMPTDIKFDETALDIIKQSSILTEEDLKVLIDYKDELAKNFMINQIFRTRTEMEIAILNDIRFPTPDSKYWQAVREQNLMFTETVNLSFEYRKKLIHLERLKRKLKEEIEKNEDDLTIEELKIDIEKCEFELINMERIAKDRIREIKEWQKIKEELLPKLEYSDTDVNEHQLISNTKRFLNLLISMGDKGNIYERQNIIGHVQKGLMIANEKGVLDKVLDGFPEPVRHQILNSFGIKQIPKFTLNGTAKS